MTDQYWEPLDISTHMLILLLPLILINYIRNLKLLAPFSTLANFITFIGLAMTLVYMFDELPPISEREMFGTLRNFSLYFGTTLFALEAVGVVSLEFKIYFSPSLCLLERSLCRVPSPCSGSIEISFFYIYTRVRTIAR